ncbi:MAG: Lon-insertion domain-containing protein [Planctomycetota bacterium]
MDLTDSHLQSYARFVKKIGDEENVLPFGPSGVARLVDYGVWRGGRAGKLTALFSDIADIVRESAFWAEEAGEKVVQAAHVAQAIRAGIERHSLPEARLREQIERGSIFIDVEGAAVGVVNGLSIYDLGNYSFGAPTRITASISAGRAGIINIEREARLSGRTHDKGVLILSGYVRQTYAQDRPMNLSASICFEQSYGGVDGDSASSAELFALLSALSDQPLKQFVAVTGSVNQKGEIQPVGGVNSKIEGYFYVCRLKGLTGKQGVIIPRANVPDLMLKEEVVEAVRKKRFHVWAIDTVEEGIELLTDKKAGKKGKSGKYPKGSIHERVGKRIAELADALKNGKGKSARGRKKPAKKKAAAARKKKAGKKKAGKKKAGKKKPGKKKPEPK